MMDNALVAYMNSPVGLLCLHTDGSSITRVQFTEDLHEPSLPLMPHDLLKLAMLQLNEYFAEKRRVFDFPMQQVGTAFQQGVWNELQQIKFGTTTSYLQLARNLGDEKCIRAAASANGKNRLAIVVPCHRVIGSDGSLTGYAGGLWRKQWLLQHEGVLKPQAQQGRLFV